MLRQTHRAAQAALTDRERLQAAVAEDALVQGSRFERGLISRLALLQVRADALQAAGDLDVARAGVETALARLGASANVDIWK